MNKDILTFPITPSKSKKLRQLSERYKQKRILSPEKEAILKSSTKRKVKPWSMNSCIIQELSKKFKLDNKFKTVLKKRKRKEN